MKKTIDKCDSTALWSVGGTVPAVVYGLCTHDDYIAGGNAASLVVKFQSGGLASFVKKTVNIDVADYDELILHLWSRNKRTNKFVKADDYKYKIQLTSTKVFYIETREHFTNIVLDISSISAITEITIQSLHNDEDYLILSDMIAVKDEMPYDLFLAVKGQLESDILNHYPITGGMFLTKCNGVIGDKFLSISSPIPIIERYSVIKIIEGGNSEIHHIAEYSKDRKISFTSLYDGKSLLHDYIDADLFLLFPVEFGRNEMEAIFPSITIWGMTPEFVMFNSKLDKLVDSFEVGGVPKVRKEGQFLKFDLLIDCEARQYEILAFLSEIVRKFIAREKLWLNGRRVEVKFEGIPTELEPTQAYDLIPKIQYKCSIEIVEDIYSRVVAPLLTDDTINFIIGA